MRRILFLLFLISATQSFAQSGWRLISEVDAMTDKVRLSATTKNASGHLLSVYRGPDNAAWALFSLGGTSFDALAPRRAPIFRIDKNEPHDLEDERQITERGLGISLYQWEPRWANFSIWHGKESEGRSATLRQLMSGQRVVFRYTLASGGYKETTFSLAGAGPAIAKALGISQSENAIAEAATTDYNNEFLNASKVCQQDLTTFKACFDRVTSCSKKAQRDAAAFRECLQ